jgi:glycerate-2-kinase
VNGTIPPSRFRDGDRLTGHGRERLRRDALAVAGEALAAVDPVAAARRLLRVRDDVLYIGAERYDLAGRDVYVVGAGKATIGLATLVDDLLGPRVRDGAVVVKRGQARDLRHIEVIEAAHPVPDEASLRGGERLLAIAGAARPDDLVLAIVTGGSSSLAVAPAEGITLKDTRALNELLLACGADIRAINDVRKHVSRLKGGRLAAACGCTLVNLTVSDVVGDALDYITDLTVPDRSTFADARAACDRFALWGRLPASVARHLEKADPAQETVKRLRDVRTHMLATPAQMCGAAIAAAATRGYRPELLTLGLEGESADAGHWLAARGRAAAGGAALVAGGETTVTMARRDGGDGGARGGPSQEAAVAAALGLDGAGETCVLCLDSDGSDGPTDAAGGLVDDLTAGAARAAGIALPAALAAHRSGPALQALDDLVVTGQTGTNVNDLRIVLRG